ncbi:hypothetical protein PSACC_00394 [Paramicrosporidium saccamoebae]|uniref:Uncharacterized protein n=1 Tax=Paramicrosporidium saccamoebae TaxID=1246581 RepID=A0A2H9TPQ9_9FUNG|nr:hypothetical protein PSACC_00394 [Paramicrosporidium saccamoebae]
MEPLAQSLAISPQSNVYLHALDLYHQISPQLGSQKYTTRCGMAACLHLSSTHFGIRLEIPQAARMAGVPPKTLTGCLEMTARFLGVVTLEGVCAAIGYVGLAVVAQEVVRRSGRSVDPVVVAAAVSLACTAVGVRMLAKICGAAYANQQHVQRCALELDKGNVKEYLQSVSQDEKLIKNIKTEGLQVTKKRRVDQTATPQNTQKEKSVTTERKMTFMQTHYNYPLGFAVFATDASQI